MSNRVLEVLSGEFLVVLGLIVASALALFWFLRGAPLGLAAESERDAEAPPPKYRDKVAGAAVVGLLGVALGGYVALRFGVLWSLPVFGAAFTILIVMIQVNRRYQHSSPSLRRLVRFCDAVLNGSLIAGILIVGNVLAFKYGGRPVDFSSERAYSLESLTINQLKALEEPVQFIVFQGSGERASGQLERIRQLLRLVQAENPEKVTIEYLDPYVDRVRAQDLADQVPDLQLTFGGGIVIEYGEGESAEHVVVRNTELFDFDATVSDQINPDQIETMFRGEAALTSALIRLRQGERPKVAVTTGHGEPSIHDLDATRRGLGMLRSRLEAVGMEVEVWDTTRPAPDGVSVAIVAAPETPLQPDEVARLQAFVARGGRLLIFLDNRAPTGLEDWLEGFGVEVGSGLILDPSYSYRQQPALALALILGDSRHPIVQPFRNRRVLMPYAAPLNIKRAPPQAGAPSPFLVEPILRTSPEAWAESDPSATRVAFDPQHDTPGPLVVGAAVSEQSQSRDRPAEPEPRFVIFSSRFLADNDYAAVSPTNHDLIVNCISWLQDRPDLVGIPPKSYVARVLTVDANTRAKLILLPTMMAVSLLVGMGLAMYLARKD